MTNNKDRFDLKELSSKWAQGKISAEESIWLEKWYMSFDDKQALIPGGRHKDSESLREAMLTNIREGLNLNQKIHAPVFRIKRIAIAASILIGLSAIGLFFIMQKNGSASFVKNDIAPGNNKAILLLANGRKIILNNANNGILTADNGVAVHKTANGLVVYTPLDKSHNNKAAYNTLTTPRGGQYALMLSDGTKVILNAASSITYPTVFSGQVRSVTLSGEAYFEVAHNKAVPFHVHSKQQDVEVLGTHFNVNAYDDEPYTRTTLLQGSVKISGVGNPATNRLLIPGQQASVYNNHIELQTVDAVDAIAWKNGLFIFNDESLEHAMHKISRWYNVDVSYQDNALKQLSIGGSVSRFEHISGILHLFEKSGKVHFKIEGRTLIVTK